MSSLGEPQPQVEEPGSLIISHDDQRWVLPPFATAIVGRSDDCDITIENTHISRQHLELSSDGLTWTGRDLETPNGTFVDEEYSLVFDVDDFTVVVIGGNNGEALVMEATPSLPAGGIATSHLFRSVTPEGSTVIADPPARPASESVVDPAVAEEAQVSESVRAPVVEVVEEVEEGEALGSTGTEAASATQGASGVAQPPRLAVPAELRVVTPRVGPPPPPVAPANWYPDPDALWRFRYWDGARWTEHYQEPAGASSPVVSAGSSD